MRIIAQNLHAKVERSMGTAQQEFERQFKQPTSTWRRRVFWLAALMLPIPLIATLAYAPVPGEKVTVVNFRAIRVGMSLSELRDILGVPRYEWVGMGLVSGPTEYTVNFEATEEEMRARGFKEYVHYQWNSPEITITSIVDADAKIVCVYSSGGQSRDLSGILGHTTTPRIPRRNSGRLK
jgi:hypothetical protein